MPATARPAISPCTWKTSLSSASKLSCQRLWAAPAGVTSTSSGLTCTRLAARAAPVPPAGALAQRTVPVSR
jgi:hypothetical protein